jgi:hypothetical protein
MLLWKRPGTAFLIESMKYFLFALKASLYTSIPFPFGFSVYSQNYLLSPAKSVDPSAHSSIIYLKFLKYK